MKQNKKKNGMGMRIFAFLLLAVMLLGTVAGTVYYFMASI